MSSISDGRTWRTFAAQKQVWIPLLLVFLFGGYLFGAVPTIVLFRRVGLLEHPYILPVLEVVYGPLQYASLHSKFAEAFFDWQFEFWKHSHVDQRR